MKKADKNILRNITISMAVLCLAMMGASALFASVTYEDSLVAYWNLDDSSGAITDSSGNGHNSQSITGTLGYHQPGVIDYSIQTTLGDRVTFSSNSALKPTDAITLSTWFKMDSSSDFAALIVGDRQWQPDNMTRGIGISKHDGENIFFGLGIIGESDAFIKTSDIEYNTWHHALMTYDKNAGYVIGYLDGSQVGSTAKTGSIRTGATDPWLMACHPYVSIDRYVGYIDETAVWNRALDPDEVSSVYNVGIQGFEGLLDGVTTTFGDLGYTSDQVAQLTQLYADGKASLPVEALDLGDDITWNYLSGNLPGDTGGAVYDIGDSWIYEGKYYIKLGSGLEGNPLGSVPEIPAGILPFFGALLSFGFKRVMKPL